MVKSKSWTGNINRARLSSDTQLFNSPDNPPLDKTQTYFKYSGSIASGSTSTKSSPGHASYKTSKITGLGKHDNMPNLRNSRHSSDYSIVSLTANPAIALPNSQNQKVPDPSDPLIDLNNDNSSNVNKLPLTKVSILEAFDPLVGGGEDFSNFTDKQVVGARNMKLRNKITDDRIKEEDIPDNIDEDG